MTDTTIATVGELIAALDRYDPATPVRLATEPHSPLENLLARIACTPDNAESRPARTDLPVVWPGAGDEVGYLPAQAANALGWS
ncbi:hypothetical protein [Amycolatopsis sp. cmx-11-32]|uniref:hypothetical protein n=1 Tax=Amycolatopsis sp. cmx-11-32 TaxID=2785796 RepID=UPI0039E47856